MKKYKLRKKVKGALRGIGEEAVDDVVCATEMTGLMSPMPENDREKENYADILHYSPFETQT